MKINDKKKLYNKCDKNRKKPMTSFTLNLSDKKSTQKKQEKTNQEPLPNIFNLLTAIKKPNFFNDTKSLQECNAILPSSSKNAPQLKSPILITNLTDGFFTKLEHQSSIFGSMSINIEQVQKHTMHYHLQAPPFNIELLESLLPTLLKKLEKALPKQVHHLHKSPIKEQRNKKKKKY